MAESWDSKTRETVKKIPFLTEKAGPRDKQKWPDRLKQELHALITYIKMNKESDTDWFSIQPNADGTHWSGKVGLRRREEGGRPRGVENLGLARTG
ncbi:Ubiquitin-fold modifier-conjugating enzyme 1 [Tetrabaena socialis]|uniref:Ubiquitin-fold modifier-conjugating enzyme 1 n=1 Tax=Tetrabaena socialis TaxID=47790 RepID=A0A2J8A906_9CHLO|nr:Ubiquitin-fold modifier-conjugating enzyme 1 [Tetrabaena socialis]|eukprot:PNH09012.1 Ubiquitin-fold modifier-conjugating enzyme 1 [Tetrabaena socialis]